MGLVVQSFPVVCSSRNEASQTQLSNHCKQTAEQISNLVQAIRVSVHSPDSPSAQLGLINSSQAMIPVSNVDIHVYMYIVYF